MIFNDVFSNSDYRALNDGKMVNNELRNVGKEAAIPRINMKYLSPVAGFRAEISNQCLQQKAPIRNKGYKVINTQRTTYTIMVVPPKPFMPAAVGTVKLRSGTRWFKYDRN